jgi:outer membrane protein TolC
MARTVRAVFAVCCAALAQAGCHAPGTAPVHPKPAPALLPVTNRSLIAPDTSALSTSAPAPVPRPAEYRRLTATDCRKLAIVHAPFADDLDRHSDNELSAHDKLHKDAARFAETSRLVRGYAADEARNRAAADALDEFFKLANAEGQYDLLLAADAELQGQLTEALKAEKTGLKDRADIPSIRRKLLDLEAQRAKLEAGIGALNASLSARLGLAANDPLPLWPADPLVVKAGEVDVEQAVATGLHYRPDLNLLRVLADGSAGEMTNAMLRSISPLLATAKPSNPIVALLAPIFAPLLKEPQRQQAAANERVRNALQSRERQAEAEIRAAVATLHGNRAAVAARAIDAKQIEARITELQTRQKAGQNVTAELTTAKLDLLKAKGDLLTAATDWHAAEVKLRQAMGLLVRE